MNEWETLFDNWKKEFCFDAFISDGIVDVEYYEIRMFCLCLEI